MTIESGTESMFMWNPASTVHGSSFTLTADDVAACPLPSTGSSGNDSVEFWIAARSNRRETLLTVYGAAAIGAEFALVPATEIGTTNNIVPVHAPSRPQAAFKKDAVFQVCSGGTMGKPRRIRRTHRSWLASFEVNRRLFSIGVEDSYAVLGELHHSLALYGALEAIQLGADLRLLAAKRPESQLQALCQHSVSVIYATPIQLRMLAAAARSAGSNCPATRLVMAGGSPLDATTALEVLSVFPNAELRQFYGATETSFVAMDDGKQTSGSSGFPYPGVEVVIKGMADAVTAGVAGQILVRSPYLCIGRGWPDFKDLREDSGFIPTGDVGRWTDDGRLEVLGRKDRMFKVADVAVFPEQIECFISSIPGVEGAQVYPVADALRGNAVSARVVVQNNGPAADEISSRCRDRFGSLSAPRQVSVSGLPLASGRKGMVWPSSFQGRDVTGE